MVFLVLLVAIVLVAIISWVYLLTDCKRLNIVGPFPLPILGNALMFLGDAAHLVTTLINLNVKYGDAVRIHLLTARYIVVAHPKYIEPLCSSTELITKGRSYDYIKPWLGEGLLTSTGRRWKKHRKLLTPAFHFNILQTFLPVFCKNERILVKKLSNLANGQPFDLFPIIALAALDNVTESIMGVSINAQEDNHSNYVKAIEDISEIASARMRNPFLWNEVGFSLTYKRRQEKALDVLYGQSNKVIAARREELERIGITTVSPVSDLGIKNKQAFLDLLLLSEVEGGKIDDLAIREEVDTFLFEGHDTTTSGIVFCLRCISKHEDVQNKILQEQKNIFGDDLKRDVTFSDLHQMQYLEQVIKESLRLYPSVPFIERYATKDSSYKTHNKHFKYDIGGEMPNMWLRNTAKLYDPQAEGRVTVDDTPDALGPRCPPTIDEVEHSAALEAACSVPTNDPNPEKITLDEFYHTLQTNRNVIACHSVYAVNMERMALMLNHPSN